MVSMRWHAREKGDANSLSEKQYSRSLRCLNLGGSSGSSRPSYPVENSGGSSCAFFFALPCSCSFPSSPSFIFCSWISRSLSSM